MKHLLTEAKNEILELRRQNALLRAKVEVVEVFSAALLGAPRPQGMSVDVAWSLQQQINALEAATPPVAV